jgi:hypothetical protein
MRGKRISGSRARSARLLDRHGNFAGTRTAMNTIARAEEV